MKPQFVIQDLKATDKKYIGENGENVNLQENAKIFNSREEAQTTIQKAGWEEWAWIEES